MPNCLAFLFLRKFKILLVEVISFKVLHQLPLIGPQEHRSQQLKVATSLDKVQDVDLLLKSTEGFIV